MNRRLPTSKGRFSVSLCGMSLKLITSRRRLPANFRLRKDFACVTLGVPARAGPVGRCISRAIGNAGAPLLGPKASGDREGTTTGSDGILIRSEARNGRAARVLDPQGLRLVARLHRELDPERRELLRARETRQRAYDAGAVPEYLSSDTTRTEWRVASLPVDLLQRRVEITGPVSDPKMVINMLSRTEAGARARRVGRDVLHEGPNRRAQLQALRKVGLDVAQRDADVAARDLASRLELLED